MTLAESKFKGGMRFGRFSLGSGSVAYADHQGGNRSPRNEKMMNHRNGAYAMKRFFAKRWIWVAVVTALAAGDALAGGHRDRDRDGHRDYGRVIEAEPVYRTQEVRRPEEVCRERYVERRSPQRGYSDAHVIAGTIVGGVVGNQFGKGSGNTAATVAGALLGGALVHDAERSRSAARPSQRVPVRHCETVYRIERRRELVGYDVTYRYQGRVYHTHTRHDPGDRIPVQVVVEPVQRGYGRW